MPAFLTHYACGVLGYQNMAPGVVKAAIRSHHNVCNMGLAGPDLFFYSLFEWVGTGGKTRGRMLHIEKTGAFLQEMYRFAMRSSGRQKAIAVAYLAGFLGHYCLDCCAHPLVYHVCADESETVALGKHFRYEAAMDVMITESILGRPITKSHQMGMIHLTGEERTVIAQMVSACMAKVYPGEKTPSARRMKILLHEYYDLSGLIQDPTGFLEWIVTGAEHIFPGYPLVSPLLINANTYGLTQEDFARFRIRFDRGVAWYTRLLPLLEEAVRDQKKQDAFFQKAGNRSYHTGRPLPQCKE